MLSRLPFFSISVFSTTLLLSSLAHLVFAPVVFDYATCIHSMPHYFLTIRLETRGIGSQVYKLKFFTFKCTVKLSLETCVYH